MFGFVIFWRKNIGAKGSDKMLMKYTQGPQSQAFVVYIEMDNLKIDLVVKLSKFNLLVTEKRLFQIPNLLKCCVSRQMLYKLDNKMSKSD